MRVDTIVVGVDGSHCARTALEAAIDLAREGTVVHVVTAYKPPSQREITEILEMLPDEYAMGYDQLSAPRTYMADAEALVAARGVRHEGHLIEGDPASAILDVAEKADAGLIVIGSRGLGRVSRVVRGSVSSKVAAHATCDFLVVHDDED